MSNTNITEKNDFSHLPNQRHRIAFYKGAQLSIMLCGESGLGKTTFVNTLLGTLMKTPKDQLNRHHKQLSKTIEIEELRTIIVERNFEVNLNVIDTPGFGDYIDNYNSWTPIVSYIDDQHENYMRQEQQPDRKEIRDRRVHACIYFIRPSGGRLKKLDIEVMKRLGSRVNLIPVISKADTFSSQELELFKERIRADIDANYIQIYQCPIESENESVTQINKGLVTAMPFALIGSNEQCKLKDGRTVRGRAYDWGVAEVENETHCDFVKLRQLLIRSHMLDLIETTEFVHYENYRSKEMSVRHLGEPKPHRNPEFIEKENKMKKILSDKIKKQETRFRLWETKLVSERDYLNQDLEIRHAQIKFLESQLEALRHRR
ncbi:Septin-domain-containing protein [Sporodiniella umbellata]|nr:Septin-domain-containing protein [Sporodiniella umbellata]